jgi:hypothetical protein
VLGTATAGSGRRESGQGNDDGDRPVAHGG